MGETVRTPPTRGMMFKAPLIRAMLREIREPGTGKTVTRRLLKPQPTINADGSWRWDFRKGPFRGSMGTHIEGLIESMSSHAPYAPGDLIWVRETWKPRSLYADMRPSDIPVSDVFYLSDDAYAPSNTPWVPSIHMPKWASRLTLHVGGVRIERLQDITEEDARREDAPRCTTDGDGQFYQDDGKGTHLCGFAGLWDSATSKPGTRWEDDPWIVRIGFKPRLENIGDVLRRLAKGVA